MRIAYYPTSVFENSQFCQLYCLVLMQFNSSPFFISPFSCVKQYVEERREAARSHEERFGGGGGFHFHRLRDMELMCKGGREVNTCNEPFLVIYKSFIYFTPFIWLLFPKSLPNLLFTPNAKKGVQRPSHLPSSNEALSSDWLKIQIFRVSLDVDQFF